MASDPPDRTGPIRTWPPTAARYREMADEVSGLSQEMARTQRRALIWTLAAPGAIVFGVLLFLVWLEW